MSRHTSFFEPTNGGLALTDAILLYRPYGRSTDGGQAFASLHAIEQGDDGAPVIAAGKPLTRAHLRRWTERLGRSASPELLPGNVLVAHTDMLAWWTQAGVRPGYFNLSAPPAGLKALTAQTVLPVPYPAHLFIATRHGLRVHALAEDQRPNADTMLLHSPILNVFRDGKLCWGNIPKPKALGVAAIPDFEAAVFQSWATHPNPGQDLTITGKSGLVRLWDDLAARRAKRFPVGRLKPFRHGKSDAPMTLGRLVAECAR